MKERLTGAIILVALIVLLVPELLTGPVRSGSTAQATATSAEEPPFRSYTIDLADDPRARAAASGSAGTTTAEPSGPAQPAPVDPNANAVNPGSITEGAPGTTAGAQPPPSAAPPTDSAPVPAPTPTASATKAAAPSTPTAPTPASKPAPAPPLAPHAATAAGRPSSTGAGTGSGTAWMVQLGVFANRANADRLAQELKGKGFKVAVSEASGAGRKLFRVRAGPVPDRSAATDLAAKLRAAGATASVVPRT